MKAIALPWRFSIRLPVYVVVLYIRLSPTLNCNDESDIKSCHCSICEHLRRDLIVNVSYSFCPTVYSDTKCYTDLVTPSLRSWLYTEISFIFHYSIEASLLVISSTVSFIYMTSFTTIGSRLLRQHLYLSTLVNARPILQFRWWLLLRKRFAKILS